MKAPPPPNRTNLLLLFTAIVGLILAVSFSAIIRYHVKKNDDFIECLKDNAHHGFNTATSLCKEH